MLGGITKLISNAPSYLGRCPKCMRQSFIFMLGTWSVVLAVIYFADLPAPVTAAAMLALGATALWLAHVTAFALGAARSRRASESKALDKRVTTEIVLQQRRQFISSFAKTFLLAAAATTVSTQSAFAQSRLSNCLTCCAGKLEACGSAGSCNVLYQNCVSNCNSQGDSPSDWRCW